MKRVIIFVLVPMIAIISASLVTLSSETGPHGGRTEQSGSFRIEFAENYSTVETYLLDLRSNTLGNEGVSCSLKFIFQDNTHLDYEMTSLGKEGFSLSSFPKDYYSCLVTFTIHGRSVSALFGNRTVTADYQ